SACLSCGSGVEVVALVQVLDEPGPGRLPVEQLAGQLARGRAVDREEAAQPAEVLACVLGGDGDRRQIQMAADHLGDVPYWHALVRDRVQRRSRGSLLGRQTEQAGGVEAGGGRGAGGARP